MNDRENNKGEFEDHVGSESENILRELRQRITRIESRVCRIGDHLGISVQLDKKKPVIVGSTNEIIEVEIPAMDLSLGNIIAFLRHEQLRDREAVVIFKGEEIAYIPAEHL